MSILDITCYIVGTDTGNLPVESLQVAPALLQKHFTSNNEVQVRFNIQTKFNKSNSSLFAFDSEINKVCDFLLNPRYITDSLKNIKYKGGIVLQFEAVRLEQGRRGILEKRENAGLAVMYNQEFNGQIYFYLSSLCAISGTLYKGIGARTISFLKDYVDNIYAYSGALLDALLYCKKSVSGQTNIREIEVGDCAEWLHDYYMKNDFELLNEEVIENVLSYEKDFWNPKKFSKKVKQAKAKFVFQSDVVVTMIYRKPLLSKMKGGVMSLIR